MKESKLNILQFLLSLLTSKLGVVLVVLLFVGTPIVSMSFAMVTSTSQLTEEEHSEEDSGEKESEDVFKTLMVSNSFKFINSILEVKIVDLNSNIRNTFPTDIIIPPPEL